MKIPQAPPPYEKIMGSLPKARLLEVLTATVSDDRYQHWNDLRRRPAPAGMNHEEWWLALKMQRTRDMRPLPIKDKNGWRFSFTINDALLKPLHEIDRGLGFALNLPEAITQPETRDRYIVSGLVQESITSSQLEGAATTREVAREMLRTGRPPRDKSERMILNNYLTMRRIRDLRDEDLSPELVFELHRRVTEGTLDKPTAAGRFRLEEEHVRIESEDGETTFHLPPPTVALPQRLVAMCDFANGRTPGYFVHPVLRGIILHFWLAYDHPFVDGNGRTARALFYWSMLRHGYALFEFISISQILLRAPVRYAEAFLFSETDDNDLTYFILHQTGVIREAVQALHDFAARKTAELKQAEKALRGLEALNHRQQALLAHALRETAARYIIEGHRRSHGVTFQTARNDLFDLVGRGLLTVTKQGRFNVFRPILDLKEKLGHFADAPRQRDVRTEQTLPLKLPFHSRHE